MFGATSSSSRDDAGFSLVEVLVAVVVLSIAAAGVASLFAIAAGQTRSAREQTFTTWLATAKLEQLRTLSWGFDASGVPMTDTTSDLSTEPRTALGHGLDASPVDTLEHDVAGYLDYLDEAGRWVGTGLEPPAQALYVRRWSIQPLPADPANTRLLQVLVTSVARRSSPRSSYRTRRLPGDALVVTVKTRKGTS